MKFIFDIDGTICFDGKTIDSKIYAALVKLQDMDHEVIFASARPYRDCINVIGDKFKNNYVIGLNGGTIHHKNKAINYKEISDEIYKKMCEFCYENELPFFIDDLKNYHVYQKDKISFYKYVNKNTSAKEVLSHQIAKPIKMVINLEENYHLIDVIDSMLDRQQVDTMYHEKEKYFYINANNVNKGIIIQEFFNDEYICFGNDKNDMEMLKLAKIAVVIGDDYDALKCHADIHINKNQDLYENISKTIIDLGLNYKEKK